MLSKADVSDDKLRGGFYSPDVLVDLCLERSRHLLGDRTALRVLEPSAGDGAFLRGIQRNGWGSRLAHVEAVEILGDEARKASQTLGDANLPGRVVHENVLQWSRSSGGKYDLVLANPPYVRFQFISATDKQRAKVISIELGATGSSVSNLWIPVFLLSLSKLDERGVFSVILPTEFLTGISASAVRNWLLANTTDLAIDLFEPGSFPAVLQEVLVLSGRISRSNAGPSTIDFHDHNGGTHSWSHVVSPGGGTWTHLLLTSQQNQTVAAAREIAAISPLSSVARFSVSTVTGANSYFCVTSNKLDEHDLWPWAIPLLPRSRHAEGLTFTEADHAALAHAHDIPAWMLSFAADRPSPEASPKAMRFLKSGEAQEIHQRFKTRIRDPWYRVPVVPAGNLLLSKRSNRNPRVIANHAKIVTTDTIYKGQILSGSPVTADDFTAVFHNSLTMLSAEIEGRSFGGGVLELVPSEVNSLLVPVVPGAGEDLAGLDAVSREAPNSESLIEATDAVLTRLVPGLTETMMDDLAHARKTLIDRRMQRNGSNFYG